jgi:hypothetical protein
LQFLLVLVWWFKKILATLHSQTTAEGLWERGKVKGLMKKVNGLSRNRIRFVHKVGQILESSLRHW